MTIFTSFPYRVFALASIVFIAVVACDGDDPTKTPMLDASMDGDVDASDAAEIVPPIDLCTDLGLGNLDSTKVGATSFSFENNPNAPVDYVINCFARILVDATIEPGTVIEFGADAGFYVTGDGSLKAVGTASDRIIMRGTDSTKGWWSGLAFGNDDILNELNYVTLDGAGGVASTQGGPNAALFANNDRLKVINSTITRSAADGFVKTGSGDFAEFSGNTFSDNDGYPLYIHADKFGQLDGTDSTYTGNGNNMVRMAVSPGSVLTVTTSQTWKNPGVPVIVDEGTLGIRADVVVEPGFEFVMRQDSALSIETSGSFNAVGTMDDPITIRGEMDIQGYWNGIYLNGTSQLNRLTYVTVANGGKIKPFGAAAAKANLYISNATTNFEISNSAFNDSLGCGIYLSSAPGTMLTSVTYSNNAGGDLCLGD